MILLYLYFYCYFNNQFIDIFATYQTTGDITPLAIFLEQNSITFIL